MDRAIPKGLIILIAAIQGLLLLALYMAIENEVWPFTDVVSLTIITTLSIGLPVMAMLAAESGNLRNLGKWLFLFGLCLALVATYTAYQLIPVEKTKPYLSIVAFGLTIGIACFKALMYIQQQASQEPISYSALFILSWRNFLILCLAAIFCGIFWGILMLLAGLFEIIKIDAFTETFTRPWFYFPVISIASGVGITIFRNMTSTLDGIAKLLQALIKYLLPLVIFVALLFLVALLTNGLNLLWNTGYGSVMVLWLLAIVLFFINTVYQDKSDVIPYPIAVHRFIYIGISVLPVYVLIAAYGLYLRIAQYGWSLGRCWGVLVCSLLAIFIFGYVGGIVKKRDAWISTLSTVNIAMSVVVLAVALLLNSPLLDFRKIVVNSQVARLDSGKIKIEAMDLNYLANNLARPGYLALQELKEKFQDSIPNLAQRIDKVYSGNIEMPKDIDAAQLREKITVSPANTEIPSTLFDLLLKKVNDDKYYTAKGKHYYLIKINMDHDPAAEYIWVEEYVRERGIGILWYETEKGWQKIYMSRSGFWPQDKIKELVENNQISTMAPRWQRIKIGDMIFSANGK